MEKTTKIKVLEAIGKVYENSKKCKLSDSFFSKMDLELTFLSEYFGSTKSQSLFIAIAFAENFKGDTVGFSDLIRFFDCNPTKILEFTDDFKYLCAKGIFRKQKSRFKKKFSVANDQYSINENILEAILNNEPLPDVQEAKISDVFQVLEELNNIGKNCYDGDISTQELFTKTKELIKNYLHFPLLRIINHFEFKIEDAYLYLYLIWKTIDGDKATDIVRACETVFDNTTKRFNFMQKLLSGDNALIKNNYIEIVEPHFFNCSEMKLSENSINLLRECEINLFDHDQKKKNKKNENVISPAEIPYRELIFRESEMQQLFVLKDLLNDKKFKETQNRLIDKKLQPGVTVLLHGVPGSGKTEVVNQIAKETQREVYKVDISQTKSKWFGESEQIIKKLFTDYKAFAKECERMPILLMNEADAIISKRKPIESSNLAQTENTIQNIILEELENFQGILIATTNLTNNIDSAFERRFLFKIQFNKPDSSIRAKIWKSKFPLLELMECELLAEKYDLSGGQIDNVLRKYEIHEIVKGVKASLENLLAFCKEETLTNHRSKVGFIHSA